MQESDFYGPWLGCVSSAVCECEAAAIPGDAGGADLPVSVKWQQTKADEAAWMAAIVAKIAEGDERAHEVVVVAKHCSANGGCWSNPPCDGGGSGDACEANDARAYVPLLEQGVKVYWLEYGPDVAWAVDDAAAYAVAFGGEAIPVLNPDRVRQNQIVVKPDGLGAGESLGRSFCQQTSMEDKARHVLFLMGNEGHTGCADRVAGFKDGVTKFCGKNNMPVSVAVMGGRVIQAPSYISLLIRHTKHTELAVSEWLYGP
jgi:hypothetical protein